MACRAFPAGLALAAASVGGSMWYAARNRRSGNAPDDEKSEVATMQERTRTFDAIVVGGGLVGLSIARTLALLDQSVALIEAAPQPASSPASSGNSGIGCTGYDAPSGSLERRLLRRSIELHPTLYRSFGLSYNHIRKSGSLVVAWYGQHHHSTGTTPSRCRRRIANCRRRTTTDTFTSAALTTKVGRREGHTARGVGRECRLDG